MGIPRNKPQNFTSLSNTTPWKESLSKNSYFHDPKGLKKNQCSKFSHWVMILSKLLDYLVPQFFHLSSQDDLIPVWHTLEKVLDEIKYVQSLPFSSSESFCQFSLQTHRHSFGPAPFPCVIRYSLLMPCVFPLSQIFNILYSLFPENCYFCLLPKASNILN